MVFRIPKSAKIGKIRRGALAKQNPDVGGLPGPGAGHPPAAACLLPVADRHPARVPPSVPGPGRRLRAAIVAELSRELRADRTRGSRGRRGLDRASRGRADEAFGTKRVFRIFRIARLTPADRSRRLLASAERSPRSRQSAGPPGVCRAEVGPGGVDSTPGPWAPLSGE